jgi:endonuclease/exonuclease/phosphatase family metal-dependent hydrolase
MLLDLLTLNVGLLRYMAGVVQPAPFVAERLKALPSALVQSDADVILLQEIYGKKQKLSVIDALSGRYPHAFHGEDASRFYALDSGLLVLSRLPLRGRFERFREGPLDERLFARKGFQIVEVELACGLECVLLNAHTTAGGAFTHPEHGIIDRHRDGQLRQLLVCAANASKLTVIAGDLNAGPRVSDGNYRLLESSGYSDLYLESGADQSAVTWDPANALNLKGPHRTSPPQRIDHFFGPTTGLRGGAFRVTGAEILFREPRVETTAGLVTLSDHYGLRLSLAMTSPKNK